MVTVLMPAYNERDIIEACVREWHEQVVSRIPGAELLVVDDCSTDGTGKVLDDLCAGLPQLRRLRTPHNGGHGRALAFGLPSATQEYVFQTDSDRQHLPSDFFRLWDLRQDCDFVFGVRGTRADGTVRLLITRVMRVVNFLLWGVWIRDANCPFKLMRREPMRALLKSIPQDFFIPMVAVSILARRGSYRVREVEVQHLPRRGGQQSLKGLCKWIRVGARCVLQLLRLRLALAWHQPATGAAAGAGLR